MPTVTVATINLHGRHNRWRQRRELLVAELIDAAPDLVSLQEISFPIGQGRWLRNQVNTRLSGRSDTPYRLLQKRRRHPIHGYYDGVGILTRLPVIAQDAVSVGYGGRVALRANVELSGGQALDFVAVHLHPGAHDREARQEQVMVLTGWLNDRSRVPLQVIAGDFNEVPDGLAIRQMKQTYRSAYADCYGREPLATFPTALVRDSDGWAGCLDYIFLSTAVAAVNRAALFCTKAAPDNDTLYPSDHAGLLAELAIAPLTGARHRTARRV